MPLEVGINIIVWFPLEPFGFERAAVRNDTLRAGTRRKDFFAPALDNILFEYLCKFSTFGFNLLQVRFIPTYKERKEPVFLHGLFF